jgi:hypothetical protein
MSPSGYVDGYVMCVCWLTVDCRISELVVALIHCSSLYIILITNVCLTNDLTGVGNRLSERNLGRVGGRGLELI